MPSAETAHNHAYSSVQASPAGHDVKQLSRAASGVDLPKRATFEKPDVNSNSWSQFLSCEDEQAYEQGNFDSNEGGDDLVTAID